MKGTENKWILAYALEHLERDYAGIVDKIAMVRRELGQPPEGERMVLQGMVTPAARRKATPAAVPVKHLITEATRRRMIRAQQRRWQVYRRTLAQAA